MKKKIRAKRTASRSDSEKLEEIIRLQQFSIAIELYRAGVTQKQIGKSLGIATVSVNQMLKGFDKS